MCGGWGGVVFASQKPHLVLGPGVFVSKCLRLCLKGYLEYPKRDQQRFQESGYPNKNPIQSPLPRFKRKLSVLQPGIFAALRKAQILHSHSLKNTAVFPKETRPGWSKTPSVTQNL